MWKWNCLLQSRQTRQSLAQFTIHRVEHFHCVHADDYHFGRFTSQTTYPRRTAKIIPSPLSVADSWPNNRCSQKPQGNVFSTKLFLLSLCVSSNRLLLKLCEIEDIEMLSLIHIYFREMLEVWFGGKLVYRFPVLPIFLNILPVHSHVLLVTRRLSDKTSPSRKKFSNSRGSTCFVNV